MIGSHRLQLGGFSLLQRALLDLNRVGLQLGFGFSLLARDLLVRDVIEQGLILADLARKALVALGLTGLTLQAVGLRVDLLENVLEAIEVFLGTLEAQFRLMTA